MSNKNKTAESNGERSLYIAAIAVLIVAAVLAALAFILSPENANEKMNVCIDGVEVYYGEPVNDLLARLGEPESVSEKDPYSGETTYKYTVDAFGVKGSSLLIYGKEDEHYDDQVYMITLTMFSDDREALFDRVLGHISEQYKNRKGCTVTDVSEYNGLHFCSVYAEYDEFTESCGISYDSEAVELTAIYSPKY